MSDRPGVSPCLLPALVHGDFVPLGLTDVTEVLAQYDPAVGEVIGDTDDGQFAALDAVGDLDRPRQQQDAGLDDVTGLELVDPVSPSRRASMIDGVTRSTTSRMKPLGTSRSRGAASVAPTAPQLSWPSTTMSGTSRTLTAYSMEPRTAESMTWPAVQTTNMSPNPGRR